MNHRHGSRLSNRNRLYQSESDLSATASLCALQALTHEICDYQQVRQANGELCIRLRINRECSVRLFQAHIHLRIRPHPRCTPILLQVQCVLYNKSPVRNRYISCLFQKQAFQFFCFTFNNITRFGAFRQYAFCINLLRFSRDFITFAQVCLFYADLRGFYSTNFA